MLLRGMNLLLNERQFIGGKFPRFRSVRAVRGEGRAH
jgi:hypothetical protein